MIYAALLYCVCFVAIVVRSRIRCFHGSADPRLRLRFSDCREIPSLAFNAITDCASYALAFEELLLHPCRVETLRGDAARVKNRISGRTRGK